MCNVPVRAWSMCLVWKQWFVVITVQKVWDAPIENFSCEREVGNIHNTFAVAISCKGWRRIASLWVIPISATFFQASELVMTPSYYESHETEAINSLVTL